MTTTVEHTTHCQLYIGMTADELMDRHNIQLYHGYRGGSPVTGGQEFCLIREAETGAAIGLLGFVRGGADIIVMGGPSCRLASPDTVAAWRAHAESEYQRSLAA